MGNEQSGRQEPRRETQQDAMRKALDAQRRIYEQRNQELNYRTAISESRAEEAVRKANSEAEAAAKAQATARAEAVARANAEARARESARKAAIEAEAAAKARALAQAEAAARTQAEAREREAARKAASEAEAAAKAQAIAKAEAAARAEADARAEAAVRAETTARAREAARKAIAEAEAAAKAEEAAKAQAATIAQAAATAQAAANAEADKKRAQQFSFEPDRSPAPYQYTGQDLKTISRQPNQTLQSPSQNQASGPRQTLYPSLSDATRPGNVHNFQFSENRPFSENTKSNGDLLFLNSNFKEQGPSFQPKPSAPPPAPNRDRSASRNRGKRNDEDDFNCPTCKKHFTLTIFQCAQGHSSCSTCKSMRRVCGICGQNIGDTRNFALEAWAASKIVPCPNSDAGCQLSMMMSLMNVHIKECPFKEQECPVATVYGYCPWRGKLNQISSHFNFAHIDKKTDVDTEISLPDFNNNQYLYLVVLGVYNFLLHARVSRVDNKLYMAAQLIGTSMSANKWYYEIHVYNKGEARRKYVYSDNCTSSKESVNELFSDGKCAVLPLAYANSFINRRDGVFTYKLFIKKTNEDRAKNFKNKATRGGRGGHKNSQNSN